MVVQRKTKLRDRNEMIEKRYFVLDRDLNDLGNMKEWLYSFDV
jgi:hypothetical protein